MKFGLTYDLRQDYLAMGYDEEETAEFDRSDTIDAIDQALRALGHETERIGHARELMKRLASGARWDIVFNVAEGLRGYGREALVPAVLDAYDIAYTFSDPMVMALTLHKGMTKRVVRDAGVPTPDFIVVENARDAEKISFPPPFFIKPVAEGTGKGVTPASIISKPEDLWPRCAEMIETFRQPVLVEVFLPGREFTVAIAGTGWDAVVLGTIEVHLLPQAQPQVYSYENKERSEELVKYRLVRGDSDEAVRDAESISLEAWRVLGCRDAGRVDIRCSDSGKASFMEVNPLAGLHPEHSDLPIICNHAGIPYLELIDKIVASAAKRLPKRSASAPHSGARRAKPPEVRKSDAGGRCS